MKLTRKSGYATVILSDGTIKKCLFCPDLHVRYITLFDNNEYDHYEERFDYYARVGDDGTVHYCLKVLEEADNIDNLVIDPTQITVPTMDDIRSGISEAMKPVYEAAQNGDVEWSDVSWYSHLVSTVPTLYDHFIQANGDTHKAQQDLINKQLGKYLSMFDAMKDDIADMLSDFDVYK